MDKPRCNRHRQSEKLLSLCPICQRIAVEQEIVTRTVDAMLAAGYSLNIDNGGVEPELPAFTKDRAEILAALMATDDEHLLIEVGANRVKWVRFVYGNDGYDVICDYQGSLESILAPVNAYAATLET